MKNAVTSGWRRSSLAAALLLPMLLAGCTTSETCVSWVDYETPQLAFDDARLVVVGEIGKHVGTTSIFGVDVAVREFAVESTLKGSAPAGLTVASTPVTCTGSAEPDPLATPRRVILLLTLDEGVYRPLTPGNGVIEHPEGSALPFD